MLRTCVVVIALSVLAGAPALAQEGHERLRWPPPPAWGYPDAPAPPDDRAPAPPKIDAPKEPEPAPSSPPRTEASWSWWPKTLDCKVRLTAYLLPMLDAAETIGRDGSRGQRGPRAVPRTRPDIEAARGFAASIGFGQSEGVGSFSIGGYYHFSRHDERRRGGEVDIHGGYLELQFDAGVPEEGPVRLVIGGAIGLGAVVLDFTRGPPPVAAAARGAPRSFHDTGGAAVEARCNVGLRILEVVELDAGAGCFCWGSRDEIAGGGAYLALGGTLRF
jgi:hypothetical protein